MSSALLPDVVLPPELITRPEDVSVEHIAKVRKLGYGRDTRSDEEIAGYVAEITNHSRYMRVCLGEPERCHWCGESISRHPREYEHPANMDHVIPRTTLIKWGISFYHHIRNPDNLVWACTRCNNKRSDRNGPFSPKKRVWLFEFIPGEVEAWVIPGGYEPVYQR